MEHTSAIRTYMSIMTERDVAIRERNMALDERRRAFAERDMAMLQRDAAIAERNSALEERDKALHALQVEENSMYESEMPPDYTTHHHMSEPGYDHSHIPTSNSSHNERVKPVKTEQVKEEKGASSTKKQAKPPKMSQQVNVGTSKVWGSDALNMMM